MSIQLIAVQFGVKLQTNQSLGAVVITISQSIFLFRSGPELYLGLGLGSGGSPGQFHRQLFLMGNRLGLIKGSHYPIVPSLGSRASTTSQSMLNQTNI